MEVSGQHHPPAALPATNNLGTHLIGGWVGPKAGLDLLKKRRTSRPWRDSNPGPWLSWLLDLLVSEIRNGHEKGPPNYTLIL